MAKQYGVSGNRPVWGSLTTGEHISTLDGASGRTVYAEMERSDDRIGAVLEARRLPIIRNQYRVEAPTDDARDVEIAEFVQDNLFNRMSMSWQDTLRHVMLMDVYGFSPFEKLYARSKADGKIRLSKLDPRLPASIENWHYKNDSLDHIEQLGADGETYNIPIERCAVFTRNRVGDNWEGRSALRSVYGLWKIKNQMLKIAAIKHDRYGVGVPVATAPEGVDSESEAWSSMEDILEDFHAQQASYIIQPSGWDLKILTPESGKGGTDVEGFIKQLNEDIAVSLLAQFLNLGTSESGSRSLGQSFIDFFLMSEQEAANYIAGIISRFVIKELVDYNWTGVSEYPQLKAAEIRDLDYDVISNLKTAGVLTAEGELENTIRKKLGLPEIEEDERPPQPAPEPEAPPADETAPDEDEKEDPEDPDVEAHDHPRVFSQVPDEISEFMVFDAISADLDAAEEELLSQVLETRENQIASLVNQIVAGKAVRNITVPGKKDMFDDVVRAFKRQVKTGRAEVKDEVRRQNAQYALADPISDEMFVELVLEELSLLVDGASDKLKAMVAKMGLDLQKAGYSGDTLRSELLRRVPDISEQTWRDLVGTAVGEGWGHGRRQELIAIEGGVDRYMRLGILDRNLCGVCREKDQKEVTPADPDFRVPDQECEGGPGRCRCIIVAIMRAEVAA